MKKTSGSRGHLDSQLPIVQLILSQPATEEVAGSDAEPARVGEQLLTVQAGQQAAASEHLDIQPNSGNCNYYYKVHFLYHSCKCSNIHFL